MVPSSILSEPYSKELCSGLVNSAPSVDAELAAFFNRSLETNDLTEVQRVLALELSLECGICPELDKEITAAQSWPDAFKAWKSWSEAQAAASRSESMED